MTMTYKLDLDNHPLDLHAEIQVRMSVSSPVRARHTHREIVPKLLHPTRRWCRVYQMQSYRSGYHITEWDDHLQSCGSGSEPSATSPWFAFGSSLLYRNIICISINGMGDRVSHPLSMEWNCINSHIAGMTHTNWVTQYPFGSFSIPSYLQYTHRSVIFGTVVGLMSNCTENIDVFRLTIDSLTVINNLLLVLE